MSSSFSASPFPGGSSSSACSSCGTTLLRCRWKCSLQIAIISSVSLTMLPSWSFIAFNGLFLLPSSSLSILNNLLLLFCLRSLSICYTLCSKFLSFSLPTFSFDISVGLSIILPHFSVYSVLKHIHSCISSFLTSPLQVRWHTWCNGLSRKAHGILCDFVCHFIYMSEASVVFQSISSRGSNLPPLLTSNSLAISWLTSSSSTLNFLDVFLLYSFLTLTISSAISNEWSYPILQNCRLFSFLLHFSSFFYYDIVNLCHCITIRRYYYPLYIISLYYPLAFTMLFIAHNWSSIYPRRLHRPYS